MKKSLFLLAASLFFVVSCTKEGSNVFEGSYWTEEYQTLEQAGLDLPNTLIDYNENNTTFINHDNALVTLGRVLFYDKNLSAAGEISCASCHDQSLAFADDEALSVGVRGERTTRNSMALGQFQNFREYYGGSNPIPLFWDGRQTTFHDQMVETMSNPIEMDIDMNQMTSRVNDLPYYQVLSKYAYQSTDRLSAEDITGAIDAFMKTLINFESKFDDNYSGGSLTTNFSGFSASENRGKNLFINSGCDNCHILDGSNTVTFANNGLDMNSADLGQEIATQSSFDRGKFKTPKLRNIAVTGPYMHDGRFETLDEVLDFYSTGIQSTTNLHSDLKSGGQAKKFNFSSQDKEDMIAFFNTLTDHNLLTAEKWSDPYN